MEHAGSRYSICKVCEWFHVKIRKMKGKERWAYFWTEVCRASWPFSIFGAAGPVSYMQPGGNSPEILNSPGRMSLDCLLYLCNDLSYYCGADVNTLLPTDTCPANVTQTCLPNCLVTQSSVDPESVKQHNLQCVLCCINIVSAILSFHWIYVMSSCQLLCH